MYQCPSVSLAHGNNIKIFCYRQHQMCIVAWIFSEVRAHCRELASVCMMRKASSSFLFADRIFIQFQTRDFHINLLSESLGVFNTNTFSCLKVLLHTETCICECVCVCMLLCKCLFPVSFFVWERYCRRRQTNTSHTVPTW